MTKRKIKAFRKIVLPFISKHLLDIDYEGQGKCDAEEFAKDFNEILDLAAKALKQESIDNVLNKITGELKSAKKKWWYGVDDDCFMKLLDVLDIIDKHKKESEAAE